MMVKKSNVMPECAKKILFLDKNISRTFLHALLNGARCIEFALFCMRGLQMLCPNKLNIAHLLLINRFPADIGIQVDAREGVLPGQLKAVVPDHVAAEEGDKDELSGRTALQFNPELGPEKY